MEKRISDEIEFHYIKSNSFRAVHCDGVWGGTTPRGYITMNFYSERAPIPNRLKHAVEPDGRVGKEIAEGRITREGIIREVEVEVIMDLEMAKSVVDWLQGHIRFLDDQRKRQA